MSTARAPSRIAAGLAAAIAVTAGAIADEVVLKTGGRISGVVVERTKDAVAIETGPGRVTLPMSRVERVVEGRSALAAFRERAAAIAPHDAQGWADLARWAEERGLTTQAQEAWQRLLAVEPDHPQANAALGRKRVDGQWMAADDAYRAQGYVRYEGRWVTPVEHEARLRERAAEDVERRERRETEARVREAEARAAEAEARAREAEAASQSYDDSGIPYWWGGYGGGVGPPLGDWPDGVRGGRPPGHRPPAQRPPGPRPPSTISGGNGKPAKPIQPAGLGPAPAARPSSNPKP
jgi:hypothetical protein